MDELIAQVRDGQLSSDTLADMGDLGIDEDFLSSMDGNKFSFVYQSREQMALLEMYV